MKKKIISALLAFSMVSGLAVVPSYAMTKDEFVETYASVLINNNFDTETSNTGAPDGSAGYKKITAETNVWSGSDISYTHDFLASLDFRFDDATGHFTVKNPANNIGPDMTFLSAEDESNPQKGTLRTQTGGGNNPTYQTLGTIELEKWYNMEIQGTMHISGASCVFRLYEWNTTTHTKTLINTVNSINLRNFAKSGQRNDPNRMIVYGGLSIDNDYFAQLYPDEVTVAPVSGDATEITAGGQLSLAATAKFEGKQSTYQDFDWAVYNADGTAEENDANITVADGVVQVNKSLPATKDVKIRAISKTKGAPYGEYAIKAVYNAAAANDKYDSLELSTENNKSYVRAGEPLTITAVGKDSGGAPVSAEDLKSDLVWSVMNSNKSRTITNDNITLTDGVLSVTEDVVAQDIVVKAANKSGSIEKFFNVKVRPYNMNFTGETEYTDTYESSDAFELTTSDTAITFHENGSWDGSAYYEVKSGSSYDCVGFGAETNKDVMFRADLKFPAHDSGIEIQNATTNLGWIVKREDRATDGGTIQVIGNRSGSYNTAKPTSNYTDIAAADPDAWYSVTIIGSAGHKDEEKVSSYAKLVLYKYVDGEKVNPIDPTSKEPVIVGLSNRNLDEKSVKKIHVYAGTCIDNVTNAYVVPNNFSITVDPDIVLAGNNAQATVTAKWNNVEMPNLSSDSVEYGIYDSEDKYPLEDENITIDADGKITVSSMATPQDVYVGVKAKNSNTHTSAKLTIKSSNIFEVTGIGFNEDYTKVLALDVNKLYSYDKEVTFVIVTYGADKLIKSVNVKATYGSEIKEGESTVSVDCPLASFNKDTDTLKVFTWTKLN